MEKVKLLSMGRPPEISLYRYHSFLIFFYSHSSVFCFSLSHHCVGTAPTFKLLHWPADSTNSFTAFLSRNPASFSPLCTHYTLSLKISDTLYKDLPGTPSPLCCFIPFLYLATSLTDCSLTSCSGCISLSVLCKHCVHIQVCT